MSGPSREGIVNLPQGARVAVKPTAFTMRADIENGRLITSVAILLTAAMFTDAAITLFGAGRAAMLALEYVVWLALALFVRTDAKFPAQLKRTRSPTRKAIVAFLAALVGSTALVWMAGVRSDANELIQQVAALLYMALPFFVLDMAAKARNIERAILVTSHVIVVICMTSIVGDLSGITDFEHWGSRYFGFLSDPAAWALTVPFVVFFSNNRLVWAAIAGLGLALTGSRAPALCVVFSLLLLITFSRGRRAQYFIALALLLLFAAYQSHVFQTLASRLGATDIESNDRLATALLGLRIFQRSPFYGLGYNSFAHVFPRRFANNIHDALHAQTSTFVQMLSDGGLILFFGYLVFVIAATASAIYLMKRSRHFAMPGVVNGICAWLISILWLDQSATWFLVGSYFGPLVLGLAGVVSGYHARFLSFNHNQPHPATRY